MNTERKNLVASILSHLPIDTQDVLAAVAERSAGRDPVGIAAGSLTIPQIDDVDMADLTSLLGRRPSDGERLLVGRCMRAVVMGV